MNINQPTSITASSWNALLTTATESREYGGRQYINITNDGGVELTRALPRRKTPISSILTQTFEKIEVITKQFLNNCEHNQLHAQMKTSLETLRVIMNPKVAKQIIFPAALPQTHFISDIGSIIHQATRVERSSEGLVGVYIVIPKDPDKTARVVVKPVSEPDRVLGADILLRAMGIHVPITTSIAKNSPVGKEVQEALSQKLDDKQKKSFDYKLINADHFLRTEWVKGSSLHNLDPEGRTSLATPEFMEKLGKIILIDTVCGNRDRLSSGTINTGNIMIGKNLTVVCIDNAMSMGTDYLVRDRGLLSTLLSATADEADKIFDVLTNSVSDNSIKMNRFSTVDFARNSNPEGCGDKSDAEIRGMEDLASAAKKIACAALVKGIRNAAQELLDKNNRAEFTLPQSTQSYFNSMIDTIKQELKS